MDFEIVHDILIKYSKELQLTIYFVKGWVTNEKDEHNKNLIY